jgi:hypothetical protein
MEPKIEENFNFYLEASNWLIWVAKMGLLGLDWWNISFIHMIFVCVYVWKTFYILEFIYLFFL